MPHSARPALCRRRPNKSFRQRVWYTACHDPVTFAYLLLAPFAFVWYIIGIGGNAAEMEGCQKHETAVFVISGLGILYLIGTIFVGCTSCCWEAVRLSHRAHHGDESPVAAVGDAGAAGPGGHTGRFMSHVVAPNFKHQAMGAIFSPACRWRRCRRVHLCCEVEATYCMLSHTIAVRSGSVLSLHLAGPSGGLRPGARLAICAFSKRCDMVNDERFPSCLQSRLWRTQWRRLTRRRPQRRRLWVARRRPRQQRPRRAAARRRRRRFTQQAPQLGVPRRRQRPRARPPRPDTAESTPRCSMQWGGKR